MLLFLFQINILMSIQETRRLEVGYSKYASLRKDYQVAQRLFCLENANLNEEDLRKYLQNLKEGYLDGTL